MANTRISNLTASASNLAASDLVPVVQTPSVGPVKMTGTQIKTGIIGAGSVSIASGKTFTASNTLTLAGTDGTTMTFPSTSATIARTDAGNTFTGNQVITEAVGGSGLTITGATQTTSQPVLNLTQTWNAAANFDGVKFNATATSANVAGASSMGSLLINLQRDGYTYFSVGNFNASIPAIWLGGAAGNSGTQGTANYVLYNNNGNLGLNAPSAGGVMWLLAGNSKHTFITPTSFNISSNSSLRFTTDVNSAGDTILTRAAAATLQLGAADAAGSAIAINSVASNQLTLASSHGLSNGAAVIITGTAAPSGTSLNTLYYARSISAAVLELYDTYENAITTSGTTGRVSVTTAGTSASVRLSTPFQTFQPQSFTGTDIPGQPFIIKGSRGTGTGAGGSIIFQVAPAGSTGTAQNVYSTALTIASDQTATLVGNLTTPRVVAVNGLQFGAGNDGYILGGNGFASFYVSSAYNLYVRNASTSISVDGSWKFGFTNGAANAAPDTVLARDAANTLALRNGTNAQRFNVYNTYTSSTNYETFKIDWITTTNTCLIGTEKGSGGTARALALQTDGATRLEITGTGGGLFNYAYWHFRSTGSSSASASVISPANGVMTLGNYNADNFDRLQFGGTTSSFPALKRSTTTLQVRLADDSAFSDVSVRGAIYNGVTFANLPGTPTTGTVAYVIDASNAGAAWGDSVTAGGSTNKYLVWYNGTNWTVIGK